MKLAFPSSFGCLVMLKLLGKVLALNPCCAAQVYPGLYFLERSVVDRPPGTVLLPLRVQS